MAEEVRRTVFVAGGILLAVAIAASSYVWINGFQTGSPQCRPDVLFRTDYEPGRFTFTARDVIVEHSAANLQYEIVFNQSAGDGAVGNLGEVNPHYPGSVFFADIEPVGVLSVGDRVHANFTDVQGLFIYRDIGDEKRLVGALSACF